MELIDFILHVDEHLLEFITNYGLWIYAILFLIIFVETGLVVMPFLPGDSLLFAAGALAVSTGAMNPWLLGVLLFIAAVLGDTLNYHIGKYIGPRLFAQNLNRDGGNCKSGERGVISTPSQYFSLVFLFDFQDKDSSILDHSAPKMQ